MKNAENSSDFAFLDKVGGANREVDAQLWGIQPGSPKTLPYVPEQRAVGTLPPPGYVPAQGGHSPKAPRPPPLAQQLGDPRPQGPTGNAACSMRTATWHRN